MKVLIVEDESMLLKMYVSKFKTLGYEVEQAVDGEEALVKMKTFKPELVLMDVMMPKMDGITAVEKAKQDAEIKDIPIVMLTNLSGVTDVKRAIDKGALFYIVKSNLTPSQVAEKAKQIIESIRSGNQNYLEHYNEGEAPVRLPVSEPTEDPKN